MLSTSILVSGGIDVLFSTSILGQHHMLMPPLTKMDVDNSTCFLLPPLIRMDVDNMSMPPLTRMDVDNITC
jgi:hypothetical protein